MRTADGYRFTLQWGADSDEKVRAGDLLESLGNRKSEFIVHAVAEYLAANPAVITERKLQVTIRREFSQEQIKKIKKIFTAILDKKLTAVAANHSGHYSGIDPVLLKPDIDEMLENLDVFL